MASLLSIPLLLLAFSIPRGSVSSRSYRTDERIKDADSKPVLESGYSTGSIRFDPSHVVQFLWRPRAFLYEGFLSDEECDHLISLAHGKLEKSLVLDPATGKSIVTPHRTSSGMFVARGQDDIVARIEDRISAWTFLPKEHGEPIQILHYGLGEKYHPHHDYYLDQSRLAFGGHRIATVLMYLSNVTFGGETIFPSLELKQPQAKDDTWSYCTKSAYAVKPIKGNALLFFSLHLNATIDKSSRHGGCPVVRGEKWLATKWIHVRPVIMDKSESADGSECTDEDDNCPQWAALGECQKNPVYMVGTPDYYGTCRKSCNVC